MIDAFKSEERRRKDLYEYLLKKSQPANTREFSTGSRIYVLRGYHDDRPEMIDENTVEYVAATVNGPSSGTAIYIQFDNGIGWHLNARGRAVDIRHMNEYTESHPVSLELDTTHLDKLVLEDGSKQEIISVLKQYKNMAKIFKEWGLEDILEYGKAMSLLFYGKPGTGKTWGASCIAKALGKELLVISSSQIETSEPGGAERNIEAAFAQASAKGHVLFFDECDGLITDRADVGMILAAQINTMLTQLEKFNGVVIFATNRADTLDPAMARRISLMVEFPEPDFETRKKIWTTLLPKKMPLAPDVDIEKLAKFEMTGGYIKNVILNAARYAAADDKHHVEKVDFAKAIKRIEDTKDIMGTHTSRRKDFHRATGHSEVVEKVKA